MTSTSSVIAASSPCFCSPLNRKSRESPNQLNAQFSRRRSFSLSQRWTCKGRNVKDQTNSRLFSSWKYNEAVNGKGSFGHFKEQLGSVNCFRSCQWRRGYTRRQPRGMFMDKSSFPYHPHSSLGRTRKSVQIPYAASGPDEPHVASTSWPETSFEKQELDSWSPEAEKAAVEGFLRSPLPLHPKLHRGQLNNGLRYIILPNKIPANRFEAHMEVHARSINEEEDEQGIAHMIEHVAFLGSKKREKLLGTGARSNAYTDFHHTVFHVHSPTSPKDSNEDLLSSVLDGTKRDSLPP